MNCKEVDCTTVARTTTRSREEDQNRHFCYPAKIGVVGSGRRKRGRGRRMLMMMMKLILLLMVMMTKEVDEKEMGRGVGRRRDSGLRELVTCH